MNTLLVCGLGRCGSSLVMQMLAKAGLPTTGEYPGFEDEHTMARPAERMPWYLQNQDRVIKVLDIHRWSPPAGLECKVIWIDRDFKEQARSIVKFAQVMLGEAVRTESFTAANIARALPRDRKLCLSALSGLTADILNLKFENLLSEPGQAAAQMQDFLGQDLPIEAMAAVVRSRPPTCLPYLLEEELIAEIPE